MEDYTHNISFDYDEDYLDEVCDKGEVAKFGSSIIPIFFSIVITLSLTGNILVLVTLALYENMKSLTNIFIANLAISDLVFTFGLPFWAVYHIWGWMFSELVCKIVNFIFFTGFYSSILFLTNVTIYINLVAVEPPSDEGSLKLWTGVFLSFFVWMISTGAAMPSLLQTSLVLVHHNGTHSWGCEYSSFQWKIIGMSQQNVFFLVAFAAVTLCYINILRRIAGTRSERKNRAVKLVFCIVTVFFVCWVPYNVVIFLRVLHYSEVNMFNDCGMSIQLDYAFYVCRLIAFSHCCLNPVFYALVDVKFRNHSKLMLLFRRPSPVDDQEVRIRNLVSYRSM